MSQLCDTCDEESFNSFLSGVFLTRRNINNIELCSLMANFQNKYNIFIVGDSFVLEIDMHTYGLQLIDNYDDIIIVNNKKVTIREYLNIMASDRVKEFFGIVNETKEVQKISALKKLKRRII